MLPDRLPRPGKKLKETLNKNSNKTLRETGLERKDFFSVFLVRRATTVGRGLALAGWLGLRRPSPKSGQASQAEPRRGALRFARSDPCLVSQQGLARYASGTQTKKNSKKLFKPQIKLEKNFPSLKRNLEKTVQLMNSEGWAGVFIPEQNQKKL